MTSASLMEILTSLTLQTGGIILVAGWLTRSDRNPVTNDRVWSLTYGLILAVSVCSLLIPHLRWVVCSSLAPSSWQPELFDTLERAARCFTFVWFAGCCVSCGLLVLGIVRGALLVRRSSLLAPDENLSFPPLPDRIQFRTSSQISGPFLWQFHRPSIVLPSQVLQFDSDTIAAILNHEVAHFRAGHPLQLFLQHLVELVFWFHPLVWWASQKSAISRELRCDWEAVSTPEEAESLLNGLLRLLDTRRGPRTALVARLEFLGSSNRLRARVTNLLNRFASDHEQPETQCTFRRSAVILAGTVVFTFTLCWLPVNPEASRRSYFSPWPVWSASAIDLLGVQVRDYEIDGHRLQAH